MMLKDLSTMVLSVLRKRNTSYKVEGMTMATEVDKAQVYRQDMARGADRDQGPIIRDLQAGKLQQKEIAAKYGISQGRVSQIKARAIKRGLLSPDFGADG